MTFQAVPDTVQIDMVFTMNGESVQNVFYAELPGGYNQASLQALADQVDVQWNGTWRSDQPTEVIYIRTDVRGLAVPNDLFATQNANSNPGTHASETLPNNVTFAIKKLSGLTGRSARGRTYWIGIPSSQLLAADENRIATAYIDLIVANVDSIRTGIIAVAGWDPVLVSRFADGVERDPGITFPWIGTSFTDNILDTHRSRMPR